MSDRESKIDEFVAITGVSREIADSLLKVCNDNLEMAINMQMEGVQMETAAGSSNLNQPGTSSASSLRPPSVSVEPEGLEGK